LTDTPELARFLIGRLSTTGWAGVDTSIVPRRARFRRSPMGQQVDVAISAPNLELRIVWKEFGPQRWTEGVSKSYPLERAWAFFVEAQQVTVTLGGQVIDDFTLQPKQPQLRKVTLTAAQLGTGDVAELVISVDKTYVPATLVSGSKDPRELGVRVFHAYIDPR
jgi:hypothetical protein